jgi:pimeloyl-ACP methyl ester carboxylesterase
MSWLSGLKKLAASTVIEVTDLVQKTHRHAAKQQVQRLQLIEPIGQAAELIDGVHMAIADTVYDTIRAVTRGLDVGSDVVLELIEAADDRPARASRTDETGAPPWAVDAALGALNGFFGDFLHRQGNELDLGMSLLAENRALFTAISPKEAALGGKLVIFVHGLAVTDRCWSHRSEVLWGEPDVTFASKLRADLDITPLFLRYNSGRHIAVNGTLLSGLLQKLHDALGDALEQLVLIGHSMGGVVARSAAYQGQDKPWTQKLTDVICIGSPHTGAPLENGTHLLSSALGAIDDPSTRAIEQILKARSAGIKALRNGEIVDSAAAADSLEPSRFLDHVAYTFIASTITRDPQHPMGQLIGDWLVRLPSALATDPIEARGQLPMRAVVGGIGHVDLVNHPDIYALILERLHGTIL